MKTKLILCGLIIGQISVWNDFLNGESSSLLDALGTAFCVLTGPWFVLTYFKKYMREP